MGVVSAQREVLRFAGMGTVQKSLLRIVVVLMSNTQTPKDADGDSTGE